MLRVLNILKCTFFTIVVVFFVGYLSFSFYEDYFYKKAIPSHIEIEQVIKKKSEGLFREACGGVIFKLSEDTIDRISKEGIPYLDKEIYGRGYRDDNRKRAYYTWKPWRETPVIMGEGISPGLHCLLKDDKKMASKVFYALKQEGAYYTTKDEAELFFIPSMGFLFFAYFG